MKGWGKRLAQARLKVGHDNKTTFPLQVGSNRSSWAKFEDEIVAPDFEIMMQVKELTGVSLDWIASGIGPETAVGLDRSALVTSVTAALKIVESARAQGRDYKPEDVVTFIVDIYESVIKESLDKDIPSTDSEQNSLSQESPSDARRRKTHS